MDIAYNACGENKRNILSLFKHRNINWKRNSNKI